MESGPRPPAPGELGLVQAFLNSVDLESGQDELVDPPGLGEWLVARGLLAADAAPRLGPPELERARQFREALRQLTLANGGCESDPAALATLNQLSRQAGLVVHFDAAQAASLAPAAGGLDGALGRLLGVVYTAMADGSWQRLKACRQDSCQWAYYDGSRNRSGAWCTMAVCGNRVKARQYRRRQAGRSA